jgi:hypothetical protein
MDAHKPKSPHTWGELIGEIGVIVLGVLIALGAWEVVEILHGRHQVAETRQALRSELGDNANYAFLHRATYRCNAESLAHLRGALLKSGPAWKGQAVRYQALTFPWDTSAWRMALTSGALAHMSPQELNGYALAYRYPDAFLAQEAGAQGDAAELDLLTQDMSLGDGMRGRMLEAVNKAERENWLMAIAAKAFLEAAATQSVTLSEPAKQHLQAQVGGPDDDCYPRPKVG